MARVTRSSTSPAKPRAVQSPSKAAVTPVKKPRGRPPKPAKKIIPAKETASPRTPTTDVVQTHVPSISVQQPATASGGGDEDPDEEKDSDDDSSPPSTPTTNRRVYPSNTNPIYGFVKGVARGSVPYDLARTRAMKSPYSTRRDATRGYDVQTRDILTRCEALADRTSSWVYLAMQHPGSKTPFLSFASRKLRREVPEELVKIHKDVGAMMVLVKHSDRAQQLDVERMQLEATEKVVAAQDVAASALEEARVAREEIERMRAELALRDHILGNN